MEQNQIVNINATELMRKCRTKEDIINFCREVAKIQI